jgi:hypothetical protein
MQQQQQSLTILPCHHLKWIDEIAYAWDEHARALLVILQNMVDTRQAWSNLKGAWLQTKREERRRKRQEIPTKEKKKQNHQSSRKRAHVIVPEATAQRKKVPRRTLLSNITDYDQDLEDDFFSELIEQVRLPTFTLEEYYDDDEESEKGEEDDDELIGGERQQQDEEDFVPTEPIYNKGEWIRAIRQIQWERCRSGVANETVSTLPDPMDTSEGGKNAAGGERASAALRGHYAYTALFPYRLVRTGTTPISVPQCSMEALHASSMDRIARARYQRALQRVWEQLQHPHHPSARDPVLANFQQVPFPYCGLEDLQMMALDVLYRKRMDRYQHKSCRRYDPTLRIHCCVPVPGIPRCDIHDLQSRPIDEIVVLRRQRRHTSGAFITPPTSSLSAPHDTEYSSLDLIPPVFSSNKLGAGRRKSWQDSIRQRIRRHQYQQLDRTPNDIEEDEQTAVAQQDDWNPLLEYETEWDDMQVGGAGAEKQMRPTVVPSAIEHERMKKKADDSKLRQADAIVSEALRKDRSNNPLHLAVKATRPDEHPEEDDDDVETLDAWSSYETLSTIMEPQTYGAPSRRSDGRGDFQTEASNSPVESGDHQTFDFVVSTSDARSELHRRQARSGPNLNRELKPVSNSDEDVASVVELDLENLCSFSAVEDGQTPEMDEDLTNDDSELLIPLGYAGSALLDLHLDIEGELHLVEERLRGVREELHRLQRSGYDSALSEEAMNARDISILREGCDWSVRMDDFGTTIDGVELLWHEWRRDEDDDPQEEEDSDSIRDAEGALLREFNAADAFAR